MATNNDIPDHYTIQFDSNWRQAVQQTEERFREYMTVRTGVTGKARTHNRVEKETMNEQTERLARTAGTELTTAKRWVYPRPHEKTTYIDEWDADLLGETVLPQGAAVTAHRHAASRRMDVIAIEGIGGTNYEGSGNDAAPSTAALGSANKVAISFDYDTSGNSALTKDKLIKAKSIFESNEVGGQDNIENESLCLALNANMLESLLIDDKLTSSDYGEVKSLIQGEIKYFLGFHIFRSEQLKANAAGNGYLALAWAKSHVFLDIWKEKGTRMSVRDDLSEAIQIRSKFMAGACRDQEEGVVEIDCLTLASA